MIGTGKLMYQAAALLVLFTLTAVPPAKAQLAGLGGGAGGGDMMAQAAPMLEMVKGKMGKRQFGTMMRTMGPMMSQMAEGGGGFGGGDVGGGGGSELMGVIPQLTRMADIGGGHRRAHRRQQ